MENYKLYQSSIINSNHPQFLTECDLTFQQISQSINSTNTTWNYNKYNIFNITSSSLLFYKLFQELNHIIRDYLGNNNPVWIQSWLNYHKEKMVPNILPMHSHKEKYHGYISINPQSTTTLFKNGVEIDNKIGQIYIGPGRNGGDDTSWDHYVRVNESYEGSRITIGFDISCRYNAKLYPSFIPLL